VRALGGSARYGFGVRLSLVAVGCAACATLQTEAALQVGAPPPPYSEPEGLVDAPVTASPAPPPAPHGESRVATGGVDLDVTYPEPYPPEVIQRVVHASYPNFRLCYEDGLGNSPNLQGG